MHLRLSTGNARALAACLGPPPEKGKANAEPARAVALRTGAFSLVIAVISIYRSFGASPDPAAQRVSVDKGGGLPGVCAGVAPGGPVIGGDDVERFSCR